MGALQPYFARKSSPFARLAGPPHAGVQLFARWNLTGAGNGPPTRDLLLGKYPGLSAVLPSSRVTPWEAKLEGLGGLASRVRELFPDRRLQARGQVETSGLGSPRSVGSGRPRVE